MANSFAANAAEWPGAGTFTWLADGSVTALEKDHYYWVGKFSGLLLIADETNPLNNAAITCPGDNDLGHSAGGYCVATDSAGDSVFMTWESNGGVPISLGSYTYTGGTGKFAGASGGGKFEGHFAGVPFADGSQSGYSILSEAKLVLP